ncbi:RNA-directed DNA polymerase, eukaryota, reverse transcriptase zinc-binding domain protein [Tanacetum coccineum]
MVKLKKKSFWEVSVENNDSWIWKSLLDLREKARSYVVSKVGNGKSTSVWYDNWSEMGPICQHISTRDIYDARFDQNATIADMVVDGKWLWKNEWASKFPNICNIGVPLLNDDADTVLWKCNNGNKKAFSVSQVWKDYCESLPKVTWGNLVWFSQCVPSHMFIVWLAIHGRLQTQDRILKWNQDHNMRCSLCDLCMDSHEHLFFKCPFSSRIWEALKLKINGADLPNEWDRLVNEMAARFKNRSIKSVVSKIAFGAAVYFIWQERNKRQFTREKRNSAELLETILETIRYRITSIKVVLRSVWDKGFLEYPCLQYDVCCCSIVTVTCIRSLQCLVPCILEFSSASGPFDSLGALDWPWEDLSTYIWVNLDPCTGRCTIRWDLLEGGCFWPCDACLIVTKFQLVMLQMLIVFGNSSVGNVALLEEPLKHCEWGYILHNDALSSQSFLLWMSDEMSVLSLFGWESTEINPVLSDE